jgi:hypothetical protein
VGALAWGVSGAVFCVVAATTLQRLAPAGTLGRVTGATSTAESATETVSMPLAGVLIAVAGIRPGALALAAVAAAAGAASLTGSHSHLRRGRRRQLGNKDLTGPLLPAGLKTRAGGTRRCRPPA